MQPIISCGRRFLSLSTVRCSFWEPDKKSGYSKEQPFNVHREIKHIKSGLAQLKDEIRLWKEEVHEKFLDDPLLIVEPGTTQIIWKFDEQKTLDKWVVTSDSDHNQGFSQCNLLLNKDKKALFSGVLQTQVPKDGKVKKSGYCNMRSMRPKKSFQREIFHDWTMFTHLLIKVRGDGRPYLLNLATTGHFDIFWNDIYQFALYTRGGPYWQIAKIPFSRFFLSSKGRVQDKQSSIPLNSISHLGISCGDRLPGPFSLELDYIAVQYDPSHTETFAYEMYKVPKFIVGS